MPLDLFLQVIGSTKSTAELEPYINKGQRLCDLPESESSSLLVSHANSRLSWLIDILRRLKVRGIYQDHQILPFFEISYCILLVKILGVFDEQASKANRRYQDLVTSQLVQAGYLLIKSSSCS